MKRATWVFVMVLGTGCQRGHIEPDRPTALAMAAPVETAAPPAASPAADDGPRFQRSYDHEAAGQLDAALADLDGAGAGDPVAYVAALRRGWLLYRLGKHDDAVAAYQRAISLAPDAVEPRLGALGPLLSLRRWNDLEAGAREVLRRDPGNYTATLRLAWALYNQGRFADAEASYRALSALYPADVDVRDGLGWSLFKLGRAREAAAQFAAVLSVAPQNQLAKDGARATGRP